jgi:hypothetical protein
VGLRSFLVSTELLGNLPRPLRGPDNGKVEDELEDHVKHRSHILAAAVSMQAMLALMADAADSRGLRTRFWRGALVTLLGFASAPFLLTLFGRALPDSFHYYAPHLIILTLAAVISLRSKPLALGVLTGLFLWELFIIWLTSQVVPNW